MIIIKSTRKQASKEEEEEGLGGRPEGEKNSS